MSRVAGRRSPAVPIKVGIYTVTMLLILTALIVVFGDFRSATTTRYTALFTDSSGLTAGQNVRAAGVRVGKGTVGDAASDATVSVSFTVDDTRPLDTRTEVAISTKTSPVTAIWRCHRARPTDPPADGGCGHPGRSHHTRSRHQLLVGGFKPLFASVDADDINELTSSSSPSCRARARRRRACSSTSAR